MSVKRRCSHSLEDDAACIPYWLRKGYRRCWACDRARQRKGYKRPVLAELEPQTPPPVGSVNRWPTPTGTRWMACLTCSGSFESVSKAMRLCQTCSPIVAELDGLSYSDTLRQLSTRRSPDDWE